MNRYLLVLFAFILQSCSSADAAAKIEWEGAWAQCVPGTQSFDFFENITTVTSGQSKKVTTTYQGNTVNILTETHSDADSANLISSAGTEQESINGVLVTEIGFFNIGDGEIK